MRATAYGEVFADGRDLETLERLRIRAEGSRELEAEARDAAELERVLAPIRERAPAPAPEGFWKPKARRARARERDRIAIAEAMRSEGWSVDEATRAWLTSVGQQPDMLAPTPSPATARRWLALERCESGAWGTVNGRLALDFHTGAPSRHWRTCGNRWCPCCRKKQTQRIRSRMHDALELVEGWTDTWRPMAFTLTMRDTVERSATAGVGLVARALALLTSSEQWRAHVRLAVAGIECVRSTPASRARAHVEGLAWEHNVEPYSRGWRKRLSRDGVDVKALLAVDDGKGRWWHPHVHIVAIPKKCERVWTDEDGIEHRKTNPSCLRCVYFGRSPGREGLDEHKRKLESIKRWDASERMRWTAHTDELERVEREGRRGNWLAQGWLLEAWRRALVSAGVEACKRAERIDGLAFTLFEDDGTERARVAAELEQWERENDGQLELLGAARPRELTSREHYLDNLDARRRAHPLLALEREVFEPIVDAHIAAGLELEPGLVEKIQVSKRWKEPIDVARGAWRYTEALELREELFAVAGKDSGLTDRRVPASTRDALEEHLCGGFRIERGGRRRRRRPKPGEDPKMVTLHEVLKYATKPTESNELELEELAEIVDAFARRRRFRGYGELATLELEHESDEKETTTETATAAELGEVPPALAAELERLEKKLDDARLDEERPPAELEALELEVARKRLECEVHKKREASLTWYRVDGTDEIVETGAVMWSGTLSPALLTRAYDLLEKTRAPP